MSGLFIVPFISKDHFLLFQSTSREKTIKNSTQINKQTFIFEMSILSWNVPKVSIWAGPLLSRQSSPSLLGFLEKCTSFKNPIGLAMKNQTQWNIYFQYNWKQYNCFPTLSFKIGKSVWQARLKTIFVLVKDWYSIKRECKFNENNPKYLV